MKKWQLLCGAVVSVLLPQFAEAWGRVGFGIGINVAPPGYYYGRPYYYPGYPYYYGPPPVVYAPPAPVYVQPAPTIVQSAPNYVPVPSSNVAPAPTQVPQLLPAPAPVTQTNHQGNAGRSEQLLQQLHDAQETTRRDAAMELGRMKSQQSVDTLTQLLSKDSSPVVREAAARALGLIGASRSLNALIYAAQADTDRDVRHSAQFAIEVIRANLRN